MVFCMQRWLLLQHRPTMSVLFNIFCSCTLHSCHRQLLPDKAVRVRRRGWFELPATQITDDVKRDLRLLHLRSALDPKRFYKGFDQTKFPKYFQLGSVVEGAADFYSGLPLHREWANIRACKKVVH